MTLSILSITYHLSLITLPLITYYFATYHLSLITFIFFFYLPLIKFSFTFIAHLLSINKNTTITISQHLNPLTPYPMDHPPPNTDKSAPSYASPPPPYTTRTSSTTHYPKILCCARHECNSPNSPLPASISCPQSPALYKFGNSNCPGPLCKSIPLSSARSPCHPSSTSLPPSFSSITFVPAFAPPGLLSQRTYLTTLRSCSRKTPNIKSRMINSMAKSRSFHSPEIPMKILQFPKTLTSKTHSGISKTLFEDFRPTGSQESSFWYLRVLKIEHFLLSPLWH